LEQFSSTGFSSVRTATPSGEYVGGAWAIVNNFEFATSVITSPNCAGDIFDLPAQPDDDLGLNLMAVRISATIGSAQEANIEEVKLVWDVNANGQYEPLLDLVLQTKPGADLDSQDGAIFYYGPQQPLALLADTGGFSAAPILDRCLLGLPMDDPPNLGLGPGAGTNSSPGGFDGCWIGLMAVVKVGPNPTTGTQFGLALEAFSADIPGTNGIDSFTYSSSFASSRNPQASNMRFQMVGGAPSSHTPLRHLANGSGNTESGIKILSLMGGDFGEGLLSRFRARKILPGTREVIAIAIGLCDGGSLANTVASILPEIAGSLPTIAGGLPSLPCIPSAGTDGFATGINGATLVFRGPNARYMQTVRMYVDECSIAGAIAGACVPRRPVGFPPPTTVSTSGGGDGFLFQPGELSLQVPALFNEETGEAIARFGGRQGQVFFTSNGNVVAAGSDPLCATSPPCVPAGPPPLRAIPNAGTTPLIIIFTVDIDQNAQPGEVDVILALESFDDTGVNVNNPGGNVCTVFRSTAPGRPLVLGGFLGARGTCGSNFTTLGPEQNSFNIEGSDHPVTASSASKSFDVDNSCVLENDEFFQIIDAWIDNQLDNAEILSTTEAWTDQINICSEGTNELPLSIRSISTQSQPALNSMIFIVEGQNIESIEIEIYSLNGEIVHSAKEIGSRLAWNQTNNSTPVSNGTYLYAIAAKDEMGNAISSGVKKLVVLR
jgi:hypothetical protein